MKQLKPLVLTTLISLSMVSMSNASADDGPPPPPNPCGTLHIGITNGTNAQCQLTQIADVAGNPPSPGVAQTISAGGTDRFSKRETFFGPEMFLQYDCGGKKITLHIAQSACVFWAGTIESAVWQADQGITAVKTTIQQPSRTFKRPGLIQWRLQNS